MEYEQYNRNVLDSNSIQHINEGLMVMKHFFQLNRKLLPLYFELHLKSKKSEKDLNDIQKISSVVGQYNFDPATSKIMLNSYILDLIQQAYDYIGYEDCAVLDKKRAVDLFLEELDRLEYVWDLAASN